MTRTFTFC